MKPSWIVGRARWLASYHDVARSANLGLGSLFWYQDALERIKVEGWPEPFEGYDDDTLNRACVALAILSPETNWDRLFRLFLDRHREWIAGDSESEDWPDLAGVPVYGSNRKKAERMFARSFEDGPPEGPTEIDAWSSLIHRRTAPKTHDFARALMGDPTAVVIDRHSAILALGRPLKARSDYDLAVVIHLSAMGACRFDPGDPRDFQARTWTAYRNGLLDPREVTQP